MEIVKNLKSRYPEIGIYFNEVDIDIDEDHIFITHQDGVEYIDLDDFLGWIREVKEATNAP